MVTIIVLGRSTWLRPIYNRHCVKLDRSREKLSYVFIGLRSERLFVLLLWLWAQLWQPAQRNIVVFRRWWPQTVIFFCFTTVNCFVTCIYTFSTDSRFHIWLNFSNIIPKWSRLNCEQSEDRFLIRGFAFVLLAMIGKFEWLEKIQGTNNNDTNCQYERRSEKTSSVFWFTFQKRHDQVFLYPGRSPTRLVL